MDFHILYATLACGFLSIMFTLNVPATDIVPEGIAVMGLCVGLMIWMSDVQVREDIPLEAYNPERAVA